MSFRTAAYVSVFCLCAARSDYASLLTISQSAKGLEWDHVCLVNFFTSMSQVNGVTKGLRHMLTMEVTVCGVDGAVWGGVREGQEFDLSSLCNTVGPMHVCPPPTRRNSNSTHMSTES